MHDSEWRFDLKGDLPTEIVEIAVIFPDQISYRLEPRIRYARLGEPSTFAGAAPDYRIHTVRQWEVCDDFGFRDRNQGSWGGVNPGERSRGIVYAWRPRQKPDVPSIDFDNPQCRHITDDTITPTDECYGLKGIRHKKPLDEEKT
jgi:hypothetical protein